MKRIFTMVVVVFVAMAISAFAGGGVSKTGEMEVEISAYFTKKRDAELMQKAKAQNTELAVMALRKAIKLLEEGKKPEALVELRECQRFSDLAGLDLPNNFNQLWEEANGEIRPFVRKNAKAKRQK